MSSKFERLIKEGSDKLDDYRSVIEKELADSYVLSFKEIDDQIAGLYRKIGSTPTLAEAKKFKRLDTIQENIANAYKSLTREEIRKSQALSTKSYIQAQQYVLDGFNQALNINKSLGLISQPAVQASVFSEVSGLTFIKTMQKNSAKNLVKIQSAITRGLIQGMPYREMAKNVKDLFNGKYNDAIRVIRTEAGRNYSEGQEAGYVKATNAGVKFRKKWIGSNDGRERDSHIALNNKYAGKDGYFDTDVGKVLGPHLSGIPEFDINCRCRTIAELIED